MTDMEILENPLEWLRAFQDGWLATYERTGIADWSLYASPNNRIAPSSNGIRLAESRLLLVTTSGAYFPGKHQPFDTRPLGDYSIRLIPTATRLQDLALSHPDLNLMYAGQDPETLIPVRMLQGLVAEGVVGSLAPVFVSYCGFQPHAIRIVKELVPPILKAAREHHAHAALIVPAGRFSIQSAGLVARALEVNRIAATLTGWDHDEVRQTAPPRATVSGYTAATPLGEPEDHAQQSAALRATLALLEKNAPTGIVAVSDTSGV